jgi:DNA-binding CsgD family transcriptional regulator
MQSHMRARPDLFRRLHRELERQATSATPGSPWSDETGEVALRQVAIGGRDVMLVTLAVPPHELLTDAELGRLLRLPPRLTAVARLIASHRTNREIADALGITEATARTYCTRLFYQLNVRSRRDVTEAIHQRVLDALTPRRTARRAVKGRSSTAC